MALSSPLGRDGHFNSLHLAFLNDDVFVRCGILSNRIQRAILSVLTWFFIDFSVAFAFWDEHLVEVTSFEQKISLDIGAVRCWKPSKLNLVLKNATTEDVDLCSLVSSRDCIKLVVPSGILPVGESRECEVVVDTPGIQKVLGTSVALNSSSGKTFCRLDITCESVGLFRIDPPVIRRAAG